MLYDYEVGGWKDGRARRIKYDGKAAAEDMTEEESEGHATGKHMGNRESRGLQAGFTIEAALLVPIILAVLFALLQIVLYLHDTVWTEAWLHQQAWNRRWELENDTAGNGAASPGQAPKLVVLRCTGSRLTERFGKVRAEASFDICLLPGYAAAILGRGPSGAQKQAAERVLDTPGFLRIAGAILEEMQETEE